MFKSLTSLGKYFYVVTVSFLIFKDLNCLSRCIFSFFQDKHLFKRAAFINRKKAIKQRAFKKYDSDELTHDTALNC